MEGDLREGESSREENAVVSLVGADAADFHVEWCAVLWVAAERRLPVDAVAAPADVFAVEDLVLLAFASSVLLGVFN